MSKYTVKFFEVMFSFLMINKQVMFSTTEIKNGFLSFSCVVSEFLFFPVLCVFFSAFWFS